MIDYFVIGGGIVGLSVGVGLCKFGLVILIEVEDLLGYYILGWFVVLYEFSYGNLVVQVFGCVLYQGYLDVGVLFFCGVMIIGWVGEDIEFDVDIVYMGLMEILMIEVLDYLLIFDLQVVICVVYFRDVFDIDIDFLMQVYVKDIKVNGGQIDIYWFVIQIEWVGDYWIVIIVVQIYVVCNIVNVVGVWVD